MPPSPPPRKKAVTQPLAKPIKILFVCVGNACRSQMAEALANHLGAGRVEVSSAGLYPFGEIVEETYAAMSQKGISLEHQCSKGLNDVAVADMDIVVNMGPEIRCPLPADYKGRVVDWKIPDPFGSSREFFQKVRNMIEENVQALLVSLK
jgi:arsenate reductase